MLGRELEAALGPVRFLALYLLAGLGGSVAALRCSRPNALAAGASGAIFGLLRRVFVVLTPAQPAAPAGWLPILLAINVVISFSCPGISLAGHLGGLVTGAMVGGDPGATPRAAAATPDRRPGGAAASSCWSLALVVPTVAVLRRSLSAASVGSQRLAGRRATSPGRAPRSRRPRTTRCTASSSPGGVELERRGCGRRGGGSAVARVPRDLGHGRCRRPRSRRHVDAVAVGGQPRTGADQVAQRPAAEHQAARPRHAPLGPGPAAERPAPAARTTRPRRDRLSAGSADVTRQRGCGSPVGGDHCTARSLPARGPVLRSSQGGPVGMRRSRRYEEHVHA